MLAKRPNLFKLDQTCPDWIKFVQNVSKLFLFVLFQVKERVKDSMYALGYPILQGAISTILGVIGLALAPSYIFLTFFKMVLLVIVLGALHGLILLPVLLSFLGPGMIYIRILICKNWIFDPISPIKLENLN